MLVVLIPLFDKNMSVAAYSIFTHKDNFLLNPSHLGTGCLDGAGQVGGLDLINQIGVEALTGGKELFVPLTNISIFSDIEGMCLKDRDKVILLIDNTFPPVEMYLNRIKDLKNKGFKIAIRKIAVSEFESYKPVLSLTDYVFLNNNKIIIDKAKIYFNSLYPDAKLCAGNIDTKETFDALTASGGYQYYEGSFYRMPVAGNSSEVAPLKVNYIDLLNIVNNPDFELDKAADIISRDTALTISLLEMVNKMTIRGGVSTIRHAAAMLGQKELKRWINTAVTKELYADKPGEMTRISLLRAKFAENLAECFNLAANKEELFLMGLFSVLDAILEKSMAEALEMMHVSKDIKDALISKTGKLAPVFEFMLQYEDAAWQEVSRIMVVENIDLEVVENAYFDTLMWYKQLILG